MTPTDGAATPLQWIALPQPSMAQLTKKVWQPAQIMVVAPPNLEAERTRLELELAQLPPHSENRQGFADQVSVGHIILTTDANMGTESFIIDVGDDVDITAGTPEGIFRATRQLLHNIRVQGFVPCGHVESSPAVPERGFHLDAARKYYSPQWIHDLLSRLADLSINRLQWHFSEHEGLRLESTSGEFPQSDKTITREEARQILEYAKELHIQIIPSLDMPGHLTALLAKRPDLQMDVDPTADPVKKALDISNPDAFDYALHIIDEYMGVFKDSTHWNLGADEYVDFTQMEKYPHLDAYAKELLGPEATGFDLLTNFVNQIAQYLRSKGKIPRVWNDGMLRSELITLDPDVEICWWTNWNEKMRPVTDALLAGHNVVNFNDQLLYYVLRTDDWFQIPTADALWLAGWHPGLFSTRPGRGQNLRAPYPPQLLGAFFSVWSDFANVQTQNEVATGIASPLAAVAERSWNAGSSLSLEQFKTLETSLNQSYRII